MMIAGLLEDCCAALTVSARESLDNVFAAKVLATLSCGFEYASERFLSPGTQTSSAAALFARDNAECSFCYCANAFVACCNSGNTAKSSFSLPRRDKPFIVVAAGFNGLVVVALLALARAAMRVCAWLASAASPAPPKKGAATALTTIACYEGLNMLATERATDRSVGRRSSGGAARGCCGRNDCERCSDCELCNDRDCDFDCDLD